MGIKLKKNPDKDLDLKKGLYFAIGLLFILLLIHIALEWKTTDDHDGYELGYHIQMAVELETIKQHHP